MPLVSTVKNVLTVSQDMTFHLSTPVGCHSRTMPRDKGADLAQAPEEHHAGHLLLHRRLERIARRVTTAGKRLQARAAVGLHVQTQQPGDLVERLACQLTGDELLKGQ